MKCLVVDDDGVSLNKIQKIIGEFGDCVLAESGKDAIVEFNHAWDLKLPFELISLDISMPDMSGIDVLMTIRNIEKEKGISEDKVIEVVEAALAAAYKKDYGKRGQVIRAEFDKVTKSATYFLEFSDNSIFRPIPSVARDTRSSRDTRWYNQSFDVCPSSAAANSRLSSSRVHNKYWRWRDIVQRPNQRLWRTRLCRQCLSGLPDFAARPPAKPYPSS